MRLSITVVTYHSDIYLLDKTFSTLARSVEDAIRLEVLSSGKLYVVDNGSQSESIHQLFSCCQNLNPEYIKSPGNKGFSAGHNSAMFLDDSEFHLVLNPDVEIPPHAIATAVDYLKSHADVSLLGPSGIDPTGRPAYLAKRQPSLIVLLARLFTVIGRSSRIQRHLQHYEYREAASSSAIEVELLSGCFLMARKDSLAQVDGFDEQYFLYFEDYDLCQRMRSKGKIIHLPNIQIKHWGGNTRKKGIRHISMFLFSMCRYFNTWGWRFS